MTKYIYVLAVFVLTLVRPAAAADYVIRVERFGFENAPVALEAPAEAVDRSIELLCRLEVPASCKVEFGKETLTVTATLHRKNEKVFWMDMQLCDAVDTGDSYPNAQGGRTKRIDKTAVKTQPGVEIGETIVLGGLDSERTTDKGKLKSKRRYQLTLREYVPPQDGE